MPDQTDLSATMPAVERSEWIANQLLNMRDEAIVASIALVWCRCGCCSKMGFTNRISRKCWGRAPVCRCRLPPLLEHHTHEKVCEGMSWVVIVRVIAVVCGFVCVVTKTFLVQASPFVMKVATQQTHRYRRAQAQSSVVRSTRKSTPTCIHTHTCKQTDIHTDTHAHAHTDTHRNMQAYGHTRTHRHTQKHASIWTYTHTHVPICPSQSTSDVGAGSDVRRFQQRFSGLTRRQGNTSERGGEGVWVRVQVVAWLKEWVGARVSVSVSVGAYSYVSVWLRIHVDTHAWTERESTSDTYQRRSLRVTQPTEVVVTMRLHLAATAAGDLATSALKPKPMACEWSWHIFAAGVS